MSLIRVTALLALSALASFTSAALAQTTQAVSGVAPTSNQGRATSADVPHCQAAAGGSRMRNRNDCESAETTTARAEQEVKFLIELQDEEALQCEASTLTEYSQRNTVARVEGTVSTNCPAGSAGAYTVAARVRDPSGEVKVVEFSESWQRDTSDDVAFNADYPIGENVELTSVRIRNLSCTCAEAPQAPAAAATAAPN
jgi:hypothetical protein